MAIPVIDFSKLEGEERAITLAEIAKCCEDWGFFQLMNHGISEELLERVKEVVSECYKVEREPGFELSKPVKMLKELEEKECDEKIENVDWEDVFLLTDENDDEWPSKTAGFKETMKEFRGGVKKLAIKVMGTMDENLGLQKGTSRKHSRGGGVVLLFQDDEVSGLQILKDGVWMDVQPLKNAIVINTGDQIEVLINGRYKSVWHRILAKPDGNRRSIASFYNPSMKATIEPAAELLLEKLEDDQASCVS
ncbi:2-oxoglutarate and oxygenase superfamily protein [Perilla frutescens var. hirtella]|nr:2-oxoglutarate and oxygenase superfamily protein [Perilla frutescens var. hirtella]